MARGDASRVARGIGRAFFGALLFALPVFLTMEMWRRGVIIPPGRLALLLVATAVLTLGLVHHFGFLRGERVDALRGVVDTAIALLVGLVTAAAVLTLLAIADPVRDWQNAVSMVAIEAVPATVGASFARAQLGEGTERGGQRQAYRQELLVMIAGAVVLASSVAPTEEIVLIGAKMASLNGLVLVVGTLGVMHAAVYAIELRGGPPSPGGFVPAFVVFTVVGYVIALAVSAYLLWTFGRYSDTGLRAGVLQTVTLALPAGVGAASARVVV